MMAEIEKIRKLICYSDSHLRVMLSRALTACPKVRAVPYTSMLNSDFLEYSYICYKTVTPIRNEVTTEQ